MATFNTPRQGFWCRYVKGGHLAAFKRAARQGLWGQGNEGGQGGHMCLGNLRGVLPLHDPWEWSLPEAAE